MEKEYIKCYLVGGDKTPIIATVKTYWDSHYYGQNSYHFLKGNELVTGTPIILSCAEHTFSDEIKMYGFNRVHRLGAQSICDISKEKAIDLLKEMNEEDIDNYIKALVKAKKKHSEMIKKHIKQILEGKQSIHEENAEMRAQKKRVRKLKK